MSPNWHCCRREQLNMRYFLWQRDILCAARLFCQLCIDLNSCMDRKELLFKMWWNFLIIHAVFLKFAIFTESKAKKMVLVIYPLSKMYGTRCGQKLGLCCWFSISSFYSWQVCSYCIINGDRLSRTPAVCLCLVVGFCCDCCRKCCTIVSALKVFINVTTAAKWSRTTKRLQLKSTPCTVRNGYSMCAQAVHVLFSNFIY